MTYFTTVVMQNAVGASIADIICAITVHYSSVSNWRICRRCTTTTVPLALRSSNLSIYVMVTRAEVFDERNTDIYYEHITPNISNRHELQDTYFRNLVRVTSI